MIGRCGLANPAGKATRCRREDYVGRSGFSPKPGTGWMEIFSDAAARSPAWEDYRREE